MKLQPSESRSATPVVRKAAPAAPAEVKSKSAAERADKRQALALSEGLFADKKTLKLSTSSRQGGYDPENPTVEKPSSPFREPISSSRHGGHDPETGEVKSKEQPSKTVSVTIQPWSTGKNNCVYNALLGVGFTPQQIAEQGLIEKVALENSLADPALVRPGQVLQLPRP